MLRSLLLAGMLAGLCGGVLAAGVAWVLGEPAVDASIAWEEARAAAAGEHGGEAVVSRGLQGTLGLLTATCVLGVAMGGLFALAFASAYGRVAVASPARTALWLAAGAFVTVFLVPFAKYPAVPPGVGDPDTIGRRTVLHLLMIAISLLAAIAAVRLRRSLTRTLAPALATGLGAGAYLVLVLAAGLALPAADALPASFPADTLWDFRQASVATQATLWATTGVVFALAAQRVMTGRPMWSLRGARSAARGGG